MATNYPTTLDTFTNPTSTDTLDSATVPHAAQHDNINDAVLAIETELGTLPKGSKASVKVRLDDVDTAIAGKVSTTRSISTTSPLAGGGALSSDLTLSVDQTGITIAESQVTNLVSDLAGKAGLTSANTFTTSPQQINAAASTVPLIVKGSATGTANLQEWQDSTGAIQARFNNTGGLTCGAISQNTGTTGLTLLPQTGTATSNIHSGALVSGQTKTVNLGTAGLSGSTTVINIGSAVSGATSTVNLNGNTRILGLTSNGTTSGAPTIASATTIVPTTPIVFISGTTSIATITAPSPISTNGGSITLIPTGIFATTTAGNIALVSTAVVSKALIMTYDPITAKWYPSY